jgi:hypothetical protein
VANLHPRIHSVAKAGIGLVISFSVPASWSYRLECANAPSAPGYRLELLRIAGSDIGANLPWRNPVSGSVRCYRLNATHVTN